MAVLAVFAACGRGQSVLAQNAHDSQIGGLRTVLPPVPQQAPRAVEGPRANEKWDTRRSDQPVASFMESLKGNDAAFHVVVGQGRLLTTKKPIAEEDGVGVIAVGDPTVIDFEVLPNPRMIRIVGRRAGVTDLSITTADDEVYAFEVHVGYDLDLLKAQLKQLYPDALIKLGQLREHIVVEGQARSATQVSQILATLEAFLESVVASTSVSGGDATGYGSRPRQGPPPAPAPGGTGQQPYVTTGEEGSRPDAEAKIAGPRIINLLRVPGVQQVMLKVQVAELNRTGMREIGADIFVKNADNRLGTQIGGALVSLSGLALGTDSTFFGIFDGGDFQFVLNALRVNQLATVLAEPTLVAMTGHEASFLAGGEFPVPVPQSSGFGSTNTTIEYKEYGVLLNFLPFIQDDDVIRLTVTPEVSNIDDSVATTLVVGGDPVPGLFTRRVSTTVEMRQGQTLAMAGLLQVDLDAQTQRIPFLGDLPYIGPFFQNTSHERKEKELLVMVTPYLVSPMNHDEVPPLPGADIKEPTDCEFYFNGRIEGLTTEPFQTTTAWKNLQVHMLHLDEKNVCGPVGFSDGE
jgi:pilus assembly protein CpaC